MVAGHLREIKGRYYIVLSYKDLNGKRHTPTRTTGLTVRGNKKRAEQMLMEARIAMTEQLKAEKEIYGMIHPEIPSHIPFTQFLTDWLTMKKTLVDISTYASYQTTVTKFVIPYFTEHFPNLRLCDILAKHIQDYYTYEMTVRGISANTIKHRHACICNALKYAVRQDLLPTNPADKVDLPKVPKHIASYYNEAELKQVFRIVKDTPLELGVLLSAFYGLRRSEIVGLKWSAIDFVRKTISIHHIVTEVYENGKCRLVSKDRTKTASSFRTLPLVAPIEELLLKRKAEQEINRKLCGRCYNQDYLDYIYVNELGELIKPGYLSAKFPELLERNGMRRIRFHDLRHSCGSLLLASGVGLKDIQSWLGHSSISTTANIYLHQEFAAKIGSANAILSVLSPIEKEPEQAN